MKAWEWDLLRNSIAVFKEALNKSVRGDNQ